jgi:uncharacterized protein YjeT (DUF2065 family)
MLKYILLAVGLVLVIEGILPFVSPTRYHDLMARMLSMSPRALRVMGLILMVLGVIIVVVMHKLYNV